MSKFRVPTEKCDGGILGAESGDFERQSGGYYGRTGTRVKRINELERLQYYEMGLKRRA